jgi:hypothetical protein
MKIGVTIPHEDCPCIFILSRDQDEFRELEKIAGEFDRHINKTGLTVIIDATARGLIISAQLVKKSKGGESNGLDKLKS